MEYLKSSCFNLTSMKSSKFLWKFHAPMQKIQACIFVDALKNFISLWNSMNEMQLYLTRFWACGTEIDWIESSSNRANRCEIFQFNETDPFWYHSRTARVWDAIIFCTYFTSTYNVKMFNFIYQFSPFRFFLYSYPSFKDWVFNDLTHQVPDSTTLTGTRARKDWQVSWKWSRAIFYIYLDNRVESKSSLVLVLPFESFSKSKAAAWTWAILKSERVGVENFLWTFT